ncbi:uncharacterized protein LOC106879378 [Octopus bimaculoides]|uniref:uncharacterized protein LOC106879378 n=1 Tax=Octopus bimaculoides TaxID=37653 RepID=UPI00071C37E4|nr:uncharacterized protein LOC106879378 [Octopus bimaculoides]|eukprot:XP_014784391.1 PREDICTED: uncharacterized protein LOC106879378 [Octopus bimaculoides]
MYSLPESLRTDADYEHEGGLIYRACKVDLNEMLTVVEVAINARNESFKYLLEKLYLHIEKKNGLYQQQESVIEEHFREINKLQAIARRVKDEKIEAKELYDLDIASFKAQILILQEQISRVNTRIEENETKSKNEMNILQQTIIKCRSHVDMLTSEKQRAEETMNEGFAVDTRRETILFRPYFSIARPYPRY